MFEAEVLKACVSCFFFGVWQVLDWTPEANQEVVEMLVVGLNMSKQ